MLRWLVFATLCALPGAAFGQTLSVLHITVTLVDAEQHVVPVPRHALLISDDPPVAVPRRFLTKTDGTADVSLRPGTYIVESDTPVALRGQAYQWTQTVTLAAGREAVLALTRENAEVGEITADTTPMATPETDPLVLLQPWQDSVVAVWTPTARVTGFVIDVNGARGLILTSQQAIGTAMNVEVQISPTLKVAGRVLAADVAKGVAIVWVDPASIGSLKPVPLACGVAQRPALTEGQKIFTIGSPLGAPAEITPGEISRVDLQRIMSDFILADGSAGGPVFAVDGALAGITSEVNDDSARRREQFRVVPIENACSVVSSVGAKMTGAPPDGRPLPLEPTRPFPVDALKDAAAHRTASVSPYVMSASDFDLAFITPVLTYSAQHAEEMATASGRRAGGRAQNVEPSVNAALRDFDGWSAYVGTIPPVLLVRVTPKMVENFWTTVARGAAMTQGIAVPSIKHFKSGFSRMRALCGDQEVTPIHPFTIEHQVSDSETIDEGLYVFDPGALGPQCGSVKVVLYSEKEPDKGDTRVVDPKIVQQVWQDFAPYRGQN